MVWWQLTSYLLIPSVGKTSPEQTGLRLLLVEILSWKRTKVLTYLSDVYANDRAQEMCTKIIPYPQNLTVRQLTYAFPVCVSRLLPGLERSGCKLTLWQPEIPCKNTIC